jgi:hypothetical protein
VGTTLWRCCLTSASAQTSPSKFRYRERFATVCGLSWIGLSDFSARTVLYVDDDWCQYLLIAHELTNQ